METKVCKICGRELPLSMFDENRHQCKDCRKAHRAQATRRQNRQGDWLNLQKTSCVVCGESEPICIDFHHINPEEKEFTIGKHRSRSREWILTEISKCVCLCANCHRKLHAGLINLENYINNESLPCSTGEGVTE